MINTVGKKNVAVAIGGSRTEGDAVDNRNYGIDALRMLSMFMVLVIHILNRGGILEAVQVGSAQYTVSWILLVLSFCAVNCFALVTGYLMVDRKFKYARIVELWLLVAFYSVVIPVIGNLMLGQPLTGFPWKQFLHPVAFSRYWYFTDYFGLACFMPFINKLITSLSRKGAWILFGTTVFLFLIIRVISKQDVFQLYLGYSLLWITAVYIMGACIRVLMPFQKANKYLFLLGYLTAAAYSFLFLNKAVDSGISYTSPSVLLMAIFLLLFFTRCKVSKTLKKPLRFLSPLAFAVYIIHTHPTVWEKFGNRFAHFAAFAPLGLCGAVLLTALILYAVCNGIELIRVGIFKLFRLDKLSSLIGNFLDKVLSI